MNTLVTRFIAVGSLVAAGLYAGPVLAAPDAVFVDPNLGLDGNPCTETQPCQTLAHAQTVVADPGTLVILSPGNVASPSTITTSLTITCPGGGCIIDGSANFNGGTATNGVTISAAANKSVALHNLSISGYSTGLTGVNVTDVGRLELKGVGISGFSVGINFAPSTAASSHLFAISTEVRNSGTRSVVIAPTGANAATVVFTGSKVHHANAGFVADATTGTGGVSVVIADSVIGFMNNNSILANGNANAAAAPARILIDRSDVSYSSGNCILANGFTATVALTKTMVTQCGTALNPLSSGTIYSYGDNSINFNNSNGTAPSTGGGFH
jgi:hypothetical protein